MSDELYYITRTCESCGNPDNIYLTKKQKAFELYDFRKIWNSKCTVCQSTQCLSIGGYPIDLDKELLLEWSLDSNLHLMPQDEELLLAEEKYIDLMLDLIDNHKILHLKRCKLIESLCVIVYDNIVDRDSDIELVTKNERLIDRVCGELRKRKNLVLEADYLILDYMKKVVFPKIGSL
jgi:hypothetical protein